MHREPLRVVVSGMVAGVGGHGGATWAIMQWVLGLRALGHDVLLVEPVDELTRDRAELVTALVDEFDLAGCIALVTPDHTAAGLCYAEVAARCRRSDVLFNVAGMLTDPELVGPIPNRVYVDLDPAFTQAWQEHGLDMRLGDHTAYVTVGLELGTPGCTAPTCGIDWTTTLPPVFLPAWPDAGARTSFGLTTVANWRSYGTVEHDGVTYGQKVHSWRSLLDVGRRSALPCEPALAIHPDESTDLGALRSSGWVLHDPAAVASTPRAYRDFVQASTAELGVAKSGYVVSGSGWFSDRSACYLASGRPVIAQSTGFANHLPTGHGLLSFVDADEAVEAVDRVVADLRGHQRAARALAQEHFRSDVVLNRVLDVAIAGPARTRPPTAEGPDRERPVPPPRTADGPAP